MSRSAQSRSVLRADTPVMDVDMLANAAASMRAAEITSVGKAGGIPPELQADFAELLAEAIPEALADLECTTRNHARWHAGDVLQGSRSSVLTRRGRRMHARNHDARRERTHRGQ